ncbi:helix-turn-helix domain-containing protein [Achromobacter aloeverae]|uniref:XRE family transcriptional regulator n=1 Tax=Achromobacter aloeverae TaxID=1750518 RepID=A0A4Q1HCN9_9BURK|nr:XRE family transcriptional regulator [Achromobacter aloeverae]RXN83347.1 XRE family transcriptional regulator [Achromobacter aloeverae]
MPRTDPIDPNKQEDGSETDNVSQIFGERVRLLREHARLTLEELAQRSGVSRAMLSKVERGEKSPTIGVASSIAKALGTSLTYLTNGEEAHRAVAVVRRDERHVFRDSESGFERHLLSPAIAGIATEVLYHLLKPGTSTGTLPAYPAGTEKQVVVVSGTLTVSMKSGDTLLRAGDAMYFEADVDHAFVNRGKTQCEYYLIVSRSPRPNG